MLSKETKVKKWLELKNVDIVQNGDGEIYLSLNGLSKLLGYRSENYLKKKAKDAKSLFGPEDINLPVIFDNNKFYTNYHGLVRIVDSSRKEEATPLKNEILKGGELLMTVNLYIEPVDKDDALNTIEELNDTILDYGMKYNGRSKFAPTSKGKRRK